MIATQAKQVWKKRLLTLTAAAVVAGAFAASPAWAKDEYRTISAALKHQTPSWYQTRKSDGQPIGCGPCAWTIVLGYWKQYQGKTRLLPGLRMPHAQTRTDPTLAGHMEEIARDVHTTYGEYQGKKYGRTTPQHMQDIAKYLKRHKYGATVTRILGTEYDKFQKVKASLQQDRPVIVLINDPKKAFSTLHYPVIEKAELKQKKVLGKWRDRDVRYYVNLGNGKREWIWVREYGKNVHPRTGSFSMFLLDIK